VSAAAKRPKRFAARLTRVALAMCQLILIPAEEGGFTAIVPSMPGCISEGDTREEAMANIREAAQLWLVAQRDLGMEIPPL